jgi:micrococcal nuclease
MHPPLFTVLPGRIIPILLAGLLAGPWAAEGAGAFWFRSAGPADPYARPLPVRSVIDGDTVIVATPGQRKGEKVRLLNVDTRERNERWYREGTTALRRLIGGRPVMVVFLKPGHPERDDYGRLLAYLFIGETNLNVEMVRSGWSKYYVKYGKGAYPEEFAEAEREAREAGRGLWGDGTRH